MKHYLVGIVLLSLLTGAPVVAAQTLVATPVSDTVPYTEVEVGGVVYALPVNEPFAICLVGKNETLDGIELSWRMFVHDHEDWLAGTTFVSNSDTIIDAALGDCFGPNKEPFNA